VPGEPFTDAAVLQRQYGDDRNLRARQRLWEISQSDPPFDFNRWAVDLLRPEPGAVVLDAGCGNGRAMELMEEHRCTGIGIDLSLGMLRTAGHGRVVAGDVQRLPFAAGTFDAAAAFMMLYHVPDQRRAVAELRRVVRAGGGVVATTAARENQVELRTIAENAVGGGWTWKRPSATSFHLEGGAEVLATAFSTVEQVEAPERRIFLTDPDAVAAYVASSADHVERTLPAGRTWDEVVEAIRTATAEAVTEEGALVVTARLGAFVCR
jgi:SAM-dependent methyltransferase